MVRLAWAVVCTLWMLVTAPRLAELCVCSFYLSVILSVSRINHDRGNGCRPNMVGMGNVEQGILGDFLPLHSDPLIFVKLGKLTEADKTVSPQHFGSKLADIRIRINPEIWIRIPDFFRLTFCPWQSLCSLNALVTVVMNVAGIEVFSLLCVIF